MRDIPQSHFPKSPIRRYLFMKKYMVILLSLSLLLPLGSASMAATQPVPGKSTVTIHRSPRVITRKTTGKKTQPSAESHRKRAEAGQKQSAGQMIEVGLQSGSELSLTGLSAFHAEAGSSLGSYPAGTRLTISKSGNGLSVNGKSAGAKIYFKSSGSGVAFAVKGNQYRGVIKAIASPSGVTLVNQVSMEDYLKGVVPCEIVPSWHMDAIKAQAVAARTYAMFHKNGYRSAGYDVTDDTRTQVYRGVSAETEATNRAVMETAGEVVTYGGSPIDAVFHASGGGYTENCENVWGSAVPYLKGVPEDKYATPWKKTISLSSFMKMADVGKLKGIKLSALHIGEAHKASDRGISGRVKSVTLVGSKGNRVVSGDRLQQIYDLNSTLFDLSVSGNQLVITGYGYGHGLGLSQWGAEAMAEKHGGAKDYYKTILTHYFTGTKVEKVY